MMSTTVAHNLEERPRTGDVLINENVNFEGLLLSESILKGLKTAGFERPSPIQLKAIPLGRCGLDLIVQAKSGTGKTCVFSVIALESLQLDTSALQVLVLAPTREIAIQIWDVIKSIGQALSELRCHTFIGGMPLQEDKQKLKKCHIAVGTPGRIKQLIEQGMMNIENIRLFILDEADKLLEDSFQEQINWIYSTLPDNKQMLALSATYPEYLAQHVTAYMRNPTFLRLNVSDPALLGIRQYYKSVKFHPLPNKLFESKVEIVTSVLSSVDFQQCLIFSNLQTMAQNMTDALNSKGWPTACIAGSLDQKDRNLAMSKLKTFQCRVLISTDLTSRGIDADKVNLVINLDIPKDHETYLHRIGRAGRFGTFGACISVVSEGQEMLNLQTVEKKCNTNITILPDPIPVDLVKAQGTINLDDMVSTEKIFTSTQNGHVTNSIANENEVLIGYKLSGEKQSNGVSMATNNVTVHGKTKDVVAINKQGGCSEKSEEHAISVMSITNKTSRNKDLQNRGICEENEQNFFTATAEKLANRQSDENVKLLNKTESTEDKNKLVRNKPKKHTTGNFWTQLIMERNDDEEFVQEFHANQNEDDIFDISLELAKESQRIKEEKIEPLKRRVAKRRSENQQERDCDTKSEELPKTKAVSSRVQTINDMKIRIPSLKETVGLKTLENPHNYKTAVESCQQYTDELSQQVKQLNISDINQIKSINFASTLSYDQDLLQKVEEILAFSPLHVEMKPKTDDTSYKTDENIAADENERTSSRQKKKAVRNKRKPSQRAKKTNLSIQKQEEINIPPDTKIESCSINSVQYEDYSYLEDDVKEYDKCDHKVKPKQKSQTSHERKNEDYSYLEDDVKEYDKCDHKVKPKQKSQTSHERKNEDYSYLEDDVKEYDKCDHKVKPKQKSQTSHERKNEDYSYLEDDVKEYDKCDHKVKPKQKSQTSHERKNEDYSYLEDDVKEYDKCDHKVKPKQKSQTSHERKNVPKNKMETKLTQQFDRQDQKYSQKFKSNKKHIHSESSESLDSSESSYDSEFQNTRNQSRDDKLRNSYNYEYPESTNHQEKQTYSYNQQPKKHRQKQSHKYNPENVWHRTVDENSDDDSECYTNPWNFYRQHQPYPYQHNPFLNMHEYPFMNAYNPYSFYNVWQNPPYFQMPHQQIGLQYRTLYKNLEMQQKYIKMMLKSYRKMMQRD